MPAIEYPHIELDPTGEPVIQGTNTPVVLLAMDRIAYNWDATEIQRQRPHLHLGQIHSALAYYYDHEVEMNKRIEVRLQREQALLDQLGESRVRVRLSASKRPA
jgi:uncharacterized protein (DUF433 family)